MIVWGASETADLRFPRTLQTIGKTHTRRQNPTAPNSTYLQLDPPPEPPQNAQPQPADPQITSIISIISIISISRRGRKKRQSTITPVRANHRRIACPTFPDNYVHFDPLSKTHKKRPQTGPTHFNHFNRLLFSQNGDVCTPRFAYGLP